MKYADLHIHSNYSDGIKSPEEIIDSAIKDNIKYISITDHDSIAAQYITKNNYEGINIIPGIELSSEYREMELHILGYFMDIDNKELQEVVNELNTQRGENRIYPYFCRFAKIYEILNQFELNNIWKNIF